MKHLRATGSESESESLWIYSTRKMSAAVVYFKGVANT